MRDAVLDIVRQQPGATGFQIHTALVARSWWGRRFGDGSVFTALFGPSLGRMYFELAKLEDEGVVASHWGVPRASGHRPRHYYEIAATCSAAEPR